MLGKTGGSGTWEGFAGDHLQAMKVVAEVYTYSYTVDL